MGIQKIIEHLLRSRLYRTGIEIEMDSGETHEGLVEELRYDGSRSHVVVVPTSLAHRKSLLLAHIVRVRGSTPTPRRGAAA